MKNKDFLKKSIAPVALLLESFRGCYVRAPDLPMKKTLSILPESQTPSVVHLLKVNGKVVSILPEKLVEMVTDPYRAREFPEGFQVEAQTDRGIRVRTWVLGPGAAGSGGASVMPFAPKNREPKSPLDRK